ncbi:MAG: DUF2071 domain-containing protein [Saprospiraceae bacterium]|jgi:hypothetical protein|nr:DUF2071 domain-containing protein [Saprospiraceae bacterium]
MSFLTAEWRKLALANYEVSPDLLKPYLPFGTELDIWNGRCYASLVGFMFKNVRLLGFPIPFHTEFEEVNLRFYVRSKSDGEWRRGVVFISELVPKMAVTFVANTVYREHYETVPMRHVWKNDGNSQTIEYDWKKQGRWHSFHLDAATQPMPMPPGSEAEFITEHYWGYAKYSETQTNEYQVTHPRWEVYDVKNHSIVVDFAALYGNRFADLNQLLPTSVMLAEGSSITIEHKRKLG